ncbi:MAG: peptidylprolyl isomerase [Candidatus Sericytochromatia bacterium]|nr:peptidylprolyl isomerase [Candidatus Tanganyikabacteria bacterium]
MSKAVGRKVVPGRRVTVETTRGTFVVALFDKDSPKTTENFAKLVKKKFYDGTPFHRVIEGFVAQGGDPEGTGQGGPGYNISFEKNPLKHVRGALGMARSMSLDSAGSQFFIDFRPLPNLDQQYDSGGTPTGGYVVFGQVVKGMDVVDKLTRTMDRGNSPVPDVKPDKILRARLD